MNVAVTLAPTAPPRVQYLEIQSVVPPGAEVSRAVEALLRLSSGWDDKTVESMVVPGFDRRRMRRQLEAASAWGTCKAGDAVGGDGTRDSHVKLSCDRGALVVSLSLDPETHRLRALEIVPAPGQRCVP